MTYAYHIVAMCGVLILVGFFIYYNQDTVQGQFDDAKKTALDNIGSIVEKNKVGDIAEIFKNEATVVQKTVFVNENTGQELTEDEFINKVNQTGTLTEEDLVMIKVEGGESYGYTPKFKLEELPENHYQISNPVLFSGKLQKVIEDSCELNQDTNAVACDYITPALFSYTFEVTCEHRDFCNLITITRTGQKTNNDGSWDQKIQTNPSDFNEGEYIMSISANSDVINPDTQRPYLINAEQKFYMTE